MLSIAIATFNEEKNLAKCLQTVKEWAREIVVVDGGSKDKTVEIAKQYTDKIIITNNPPIFHLNKQKALNACSGDWILQLDADEIVTDELKQEIINITRNPAGQSPLGGAPQPVTSQQVNGYFIPRKNFFLDHWLKKGGQYPDYVIRFFKNGKGKFPCKSVHEQIVIEGEVGYLQSPLLHYPYNTISEYWDKALRYSKLTASYLKNDQNKISVLTFIEYLLIKPLFTFFSLFFRHLGFFDGIYGFLFAFLSGIQSPLALIYYLKLPQNYGRKTVHCDSSELKSCRPVRP